MKPFPGLGGLDGSQERKRMSDSGAPFTLKLVVSYLLGGIVAYLVLPHHTGDAKYGMKWLVLTVLFSLVSLIPLAKLDFQRASDALGRFAINGVMSVIAVGTSALVAGIGTLIVRFACNAFDFAINVGVVFIVLFVFMMWLFISDGLYKN
jgi:hypothetical protein